MVFYLNLRFLREMWQSKLQEPFFYFSKVVRRISDSKVKKHTQDSFPIQMQRKFNYANREYIEL